MKGLTPQQLIEITNFVQKHHKFGYVLPENKIKENLGYCIKYIDACYDSRQGDYWFIKFRGMGHIVFHTNQPIVEYDSLYDFIMSYLNYDWKPNKNKHSYMHDENSHFPINSFPNGVIEKEWSDIDMIEAYCADLEDRTTEDTADACKWISNYRAKIK